MANQADFKNREFLAVIGDEVSVAHLQQTRARRQALTWAGLRYGTTTCWHRGMSSIHGTLDTALSYLAARIRWRRCAKELSCC